VDLFSAQAPIRTAGTFYKPEKDIPELWPHQVRAIDVLRRNIFERGVMRQILCIPTGGGKTVVSASMIRTALERGKRAGFIVDRVALVRQASAEFESFGIPHGIAQSKYSHSPHLPVQIGSVQTIERRGFWPNLNIGYSDECHTRRKSTEQFMVTRRDVPWIGLTATPNVKGLGGKVEDAEGRERQLWEELVVVCTTDELINDGYLTRLRVIPGVEPDMEGQPTGAGGEWTAKSAEKQGRKIIGNVVETWIERTRQVFGGPVKTLVFSATVKHGEDLVREFQRAGFDFRQVSYLDPDDEYRDRVIALYKEGKIDGLISCEALAKGFDVKDTLCLVTCRAYRTSLPAWIQVLGRGMRAAPGKEFCLLLDCSGNWYAWEEQLMEFFRYGPGKLDEGKTRGPLTKRDEEVSRKGRECSGCGSVLPPRATLCPFCGKEHARAEDYHVVEGTFEEIEGVEGSSGWRDPAMADYVWQQASLIASGKQYLSDEARHKYAQSCFKAATGTWARPYSRALDLSATHLNEELHELIMEKQAQRAQTRTKR